VLKYKKSLKIPMPIIYNYNFNDYELATYGNKYHEFVYEDKIFLDGIDGFHFIGANRGGQDAWEYFKKNKIHKKNQTKML
jgi:hypothetical protein